MSILSDFAQISEKKSALYIAIVVTLVCPGYLFLFLHNRQLFLSLDILRLLILSVSVTMPFFLANAITVASIEDIDDVKGTQFLALSMFWSVLVTNSVFGIAYIFVLLNAKNDLKLTLIAVQCAILACLFISYIKSRILAAIRKWRRKKAG